MKPQDMSALVSIQLALFPIHFSMFSLDQTLCRRLGNRSVAMPLRSYHSLLLRSLADLAQHSRRHALLLRADLPDRAGLSCRPSLALRSCHGGDSVDSVDWVSVKMESQCLIISSLPQIVSPHPILYFTLSRPPDPPFPLHLDASPLLLCSPLHLFLVYFRPNRSDGCVASPHDHVENRKTSKHSHERTASSKTSTTPLSIGRVNAGWSS
ncbi:unnamed protein product [Protopolystoma xenopodis]|uniref:Uncharacterized protein n=1 Tax=Protopolystoma xenopodis TaxID=117903 RepID=A0A3S5B6A6_9PLAT|nr:unnamed protein product [Protopolystoma xenopodis]